MMGAGNTTTNDKVNIISNNNNDNSSVLVFDWDDTICPSSFVDQWKVENFKELPLHVSLLEYWRGLSAFVLYFLVYYAVCC